MKNYFPIFARHPDLIFLDSAASAQKPQVALDTVREFYETKYANIHRGLYSLSLEATAAFDAARKEVAAFFGITANELVFTKNGTEASNLFATVWAKQYLQKGDEVVLTIAEHHANLLPWLRLREELGIVPKFVEPDADTVFHTEHFVAQLSARTKLIVFPHVSNVTGQIFPVTEIVALAKAKRITTLLDACQSAPHLPVDFHALGVDAAFFTGHKMGAPGGTGGLYVRKDLLNTLPPFLVGGDMVKNVSLEKFEPLPAPQRFEAGTPAIAEVIGLAAACRFLQKIGMAKIRTHEQQLLEYALNQFAEKLPQFRIIGTQNASERSSVIAFTHSKIHPHDLAQFLDTKQICLRSGFHCAEPIHHSLGLKNGSLRASFWVYNETAEIQALIAGLQEAEQLFLKS